MDGLLPIGEFAQRSGLSPKRLRSYAAAGLLSPAAIDPSSGYRYYAPDQLCDAKLIDALRRAGVPLAEVPALMRDPSTEQIDEWARRVDADATRRRNALDDVRRLLIDRADETALAANHDARRNAMPALTAVARSETGPIRDNNEDVALCRDHVVAVADGMGGLPGGEVAASLAVALLDTAFTGRSLDELEAVVRAANAAITERSRTTEGLAGMGTTLCAVGTTAEGEMAVVNVGDSRAYLVRDGELVQLTEDHTVTADLVRRGQLPGADAARHPHRNVLTRVLGGGPTVDVDGATHRLVAGDRLLLCTDGLFNEVTVEEMGLLMRESDDDRVAVDSLVDRALATGGGDNVTAVIARIRT